MQGKRKSFSYLYLIVLGALLASCVGGIFVWPKYGGQKMWSDVPAFEGTTQDVSDAIFVPLFNLTEIGKKSGKIESLTFYTARSTQEIGAFYTPERMKPFGWAGTCTQTPYHGEPRAECDYSKTNEDEAQVLLSIDARPDPNNKSRTRLIFDRTTD